MTGCFARGGQESTGRDLGSDRLRSQRTHENAGADRSDGTDRGP
jgi:hypothetical protein